jgi:hypothetical protein
MRILNASGRNRMLKGLETLSELRDLRLIDMDSSALPDTIPVRRSKSENLIPFDEEDMSSF